MRIDYLWGSVISEGQLFVRVGYSWGSVVREGQLFVRVGYSWGSVVREGRLFVRVSCSWGSVIREVRLFVRVSCSWGSVIREVRLLVRFGISWGSVIREVRLFQVGYYSWGSVLLGSDPVKLKSETLSLNYRLTIGNCLPKVVNIRILFSSESIIFNLTWWYKNLILRCLLWCHSNPNKWELITKQLVFKCLLSLS